MVPFNIFCGTCWFCARGLYSNCHNVNPNATAVGGIYGYSHTTGGYDGGQAEYVRVPFADVGPAKIPDWMHDEDAVLLTDAAATGYFGAQMGDIAEGDTVVVLRRRTGRPVRRAVRVADGRRPGHRRRPPRLPAGEGAHVRARRDAQLRRVRRHRRRAQEADRLPRRRRRPSTPWAPRPTATCCSTSPAPSSSCRAARRSRSTGRSTACARAATVSVVGAYGPIPNAVKFGDAMNKGLTLRMNQAPVKRQWPRLFEHVRNGHLTPQRDRHPPVPAGGDRRGLPRLLQPSSTAASSR